MFSKLKAYEKGIKSETATVLYKKEEAGTKVDRQTKMTNIPENRNVRRLFYMIISGRRIRRLLGGSARV
ncbi:hypothetical protein AN965_12245 [Alkalicoccobacillus plakortidis]|uniref:Uncharacterized protein n=1 Tax=Alkalicoccobacillus plakortidis TaxID=444060 RepID=A0A9D5I010_9BACI|nr:hypothetical protein AN965_12245 [Alkalicoccobacillus plakortidis]